MLMSYAFMRELPEKRIAQIMNNNSIELLLDSGAFTALNAGYEIKIDDYLEFLQKWKPKLFGYMALDKLQDPKATAANLRTMIDAGLRPIPVHVFGDDQRKMDELFELSKWVALGGLRRPHRGSAPPSYVKLKMQWAKGRKVHWLGYAKGAMLKAFRPYSCDCSNLSGGQRWGSVQIYTGRGKWFTLTAAKVFEERLYLQPDIRAALETYEIDIERFADPNRWGNHSAKDGHGLRESFVTLLSFRSWVRYSLELKKHFGVRLFQAVVPAHWQSLIDAFEFVRVRGLAP